MKFKKFFVVFGLTSLAIAGALFASQSAKQEPKSARATDLDEITISSIVINNDTNRPNQLYLMPDKNYELSPDWGVAYTAASESDGVFFNGVKQNGGFLKYVNIGQTYYVLFCEGFPSAVEGDEVEVKGTFTGGGNSFSVNYIAERFAGIWVPALEDYDIVSLKDANMPDFPIGSTLNTDDLSGYAYLSDNATLPKQKGYFGLTNNTGSYAFQFNFQLASEGKEWFHVLIGGTGPLWNSGHFIDFGIIGSFNQATGHGLIQEMKGNGDNWAADSLQNSDAFTLGWNSGEINLFEMGLVKVKESSQRYVFFKVNGVLRFGKCWTLADGEMTTKVTLQSANTDIAVSNSIEPASYKIVSVNDGNATTIRFAPAYDICPAVPAWGEYFKSVDGNGLKLNGTAFGSDTYNYFKKSGQNVYYLDLSDAGAPAITAGDILYVGGMFKGGRRTEVVEGTNKSVHTLFKINFQDTYFEYDGEAWHIVNPDYTAVKFAKDVLKETLDVCSAGTNNHDALVAIWEDLAEAYSSLVAAEKALVVAADSDTGDVPATTVEDIEALDDEDALAFGMGRYDYCTAKYSLTNFVTGRDPSPAYPSIRTLGVTSNTTTILIIILSTAALLVAGGYFILHRRKEER